MATHAEAVQAAGQTLDNEFDTLVDLMADIADGTIDGLDNDGNVVGHTISDNGHVIERGYSIGGQEISYGYFHDANGDGVYDRRSDKVEGGEFHRENLDATNPGTMLLISTATSTQAVFTGQLTDTAMKATALQKAVSQKIG